MHPKYFVTKQPGYDLFVFSEIFKAGYGQRIVEIRTGEKIEFSIQNSNGESEKVPIQIYINYGDLKITDDYNAHIYCIREALTKQFHKKPKKIDKNTIENKMKKFKKADQSQLNFMSNFLKKDVSVNISSLEVIRQKLMEQEKHKIYKLKVPEKNFYNPVGKIELKKLDTSMFDEKDGKNEEENKIESEEIETKTYINSIYYDAKIDVESMKDPKTVSKILRHRPTLPEKGYEYNRQDKTLCHIAYTCEYLYIFCSKPISADEINDELDSGNLFEIKNSSFTAILMMNFFFRKEILKLELKNIERMISNCSIIYVSQKHDEEAVTIGFQWTKENGIHVLRAFDRNGKLSFPREGEKKEYTILTPIDYINKRMCSIIIHIINMIKD